MPLVYTKAEIRAHLAGRGLDVSDEKTLNTFIRDLKKMIKHEDRKKRRVGLGHSPEDTLLDSTGQSVNERGIEDSETDGRKPVFRQRAEERKKKKSKPVDDEHSKTDEMLDLSKIKNREERQKRIVKGHAIGDTMLDSSGQSVDEREIEDSETDYGRKPVYQQRAEERKKKTSKPIDDDLETDEMFLVLGNLLNEYEDQCEDNQSGKSSRTWRGPSNAVKKNPVALYHYYKSIWDRQKIPGDDRHMKLRWNVRAATVGTFPCVDGRPVKYLRDRAATARNVARVGGRPVQYLRC